MPSYDQIMQAREAYGLTEEEAPVDLFLSMTATTDPYTMEIENYFGHPHVQAGIIFAARAATKNTLRVIPTETVTDISRASQVMSATVLRLAS